MFNFDQTQIQRTVLAAVGALILSTTAVTAAVGPAMAGQTAQAQSMIADRSFA